MHFEKCVILETISGQRIAGIVRTVRIADTSFIALNINEPRDDGTIVGFDYYLNPTQVASMVVVGPDTAARFAVNNPFHPASVMELMDAEGTKKNEGDGRKPMNREEYKQHVREKIHDVLQTGKPFCGITARTLPGFNPSEVIDEVIREGPPKKAVPESEVAKDAREFVEHMEYGPIGDCQCVACNMNRQVKPDLQETQTHPATSAGNPF